MLLNATEPQHVSLNPFEVREVLQDFGITTVTITLSLNPFEVREVLQDAAKTRGRAEKVSIPLKSGRCCKDRFNIIGINWRLNPFEVREVLQANKSLKLMYLTRLNPFEVREVLQEELQHQSAHTIVSIPLKSGRCCKIMAEGVANNKPSQSL